MRAELRDENTLIVTSESTAELVALAKFEGAKVEIEKPKPFQANVELIRIVREEPKR